MLAVARSGRPSLLKSAAARAEGLEPTAGVAAVAVKVPSPLPWRMETVASDSLTTARSTMPSPLRSRAAMELGLTPVAGPAEAALKVPSPTPSRMVAVESN